MSPTIISIRNQPNLDLESDDNLLKNQKILAELLWNSRLQGIDPPSCTNGRRKPVAMTIAFMGLVFLVLFTVGLEGIHTWGQYIFQRSQTGRGSTQTSLTVSFSRNNAETIGRNSRESYHPSHQIFQDSRHVQIIGNPRKPKQYLAVSPFSRFQEKNQKGRDERSVEQHPKTEEHIYPYTIITASSANHYCPLENFLNSIRNASAFLPVFERPRLIVYDIGLNETQRSHFERTWMDTEDRLVHSIRNFRFTAYPSYYSLSGGSQGHWAWKPAIVKEVADEFGGIVVWMDSGDQVSTKFLKSVKDMVKTKPSPGFWSPISSGSIQKWVHKGLPEFFGDRLTSTFTRKRNCNGAVAIFDTDDAHISNNIIRPWAACASTKHCIAPPGSSRRNHRQDQAVLTYLVHRAGLACVDDTSEYMLKVHMDKICKQKKSNTTR